MFSTHLCAKYPHRFWEFKGQSIHGTLSLMKNRDMDQKAHASQSMTEKSLAFSCHSLNANVSNVSTTFSPTKRVAQGSHLYVLAHSHLSVFFLQCECDTLTVQLVSILS